jgi:hypothetical protein
MVIKRKYDRLFAEHTGFHPSVVLQPTFHIHIHLSSILHIICTVYVLTVSFQKLKKKITVAGVTWAPYKIYEAQWLP